MAIIGVTTGPSFGPWKMPVRVQNILINHYGIQHNLKIDFLFTEGLYYSYYPNLRSTMKVRNVDEIIFPSAYQFPTKDEVVKVLMESFSDKILHFALEDFSGKGCEYMESLVKKLKLFQNNLLYDPGKRTYREFQEMLG